MPQIVQTNIASLNAQRNLNSSQSDLGVSLQRLSSGLRINSAKDDAAGLAISERFTTQIRGLNQAGRNANDGVSLAQTAEGDLAQITNNLQRIRELAVQSANATNSTSDRAALQLEVTQLVAEIDRVSSTSAFNGVKLLDGAFASQKFQVGANAGETVDIASIASARTAAIGQTFSAAVTSTTAVTANFDSTDLTVNGNAITATADAKAIADAITAADVNLTATATNVQDNIAFTDVTGVASTPAKASVFTSTNDVPTSFDFTNDSASFTVAVDSGSAQTITLNGTVDGASGAAAAVSEAGFLAAINSQLTGATATVVSSKLVITSDSTGVASDIAVAGFNGNVDGDAVIADFAAGAVTAIGDGSTATIFTSTADLSTSGYDFTAGNTVSFDIELGAGGGVQTITLDGSTDGAGTGTATTDEAGTLSTINAQLTGATASVVGGKLTFTADAVGVNTAVVNNYVANTAVVADFASGTETTAGAAIVDPVSTYTLSVDGTALDLSSASTDGTITSAEIFAAIESLTGYSAEAGTSGIKVTKDDGSNFTLAETGTNIATQGIAATTTADTTYRGIVASVTSASGPLTIAGTTPGDAGLAAAVTAVGTTLTGTTIASTDISTVDGANAALLSADSALTLISNTRSSLGAIQNRFESIVSSISTSVENLSAARSRIRDADFAAETAALTRNQILQQAGVSILSQANALPQLALSLLQ